jgi:transposase
MNTPTPTVRYLEAVHGRTIDAILRELYEGEGLSQAEVGERLGVSRWTVIRWMAAYRIPTRDRRRVA